MLEFFFKNFVLMKVGLIYVHIELKNSEKTQTNSWQHRKTDV